MDLTISAAPFELAGLRRAARDVLGQLPTQVADEMLLALDEAATNAILHGSGGGDPIQVAIRVRDPWVEATVLDHGPTTPPQPSSATDRRSGGGWGLWLLRCLVDEVRLERVEGGTRVTLRRRIRPPSPVTGAGGTRRPLARSAKGGPADRQQPAAKVPWRIEEPPVASDPEKIAETLRQLARLDPVELGQQAVLERIVQAAATCCDSSGGVGLLLLDHDQQLRYVAAAGRPRRALAGSQVRLGEGPSVDAFLQDAPVASRDLAGEPRWPDFRPLALAAGIRAWLSAPVRQRHGPIGVLDFARTDPQPWPPQDLAAANAFAGLIVTTLQLATAHQQQALSPALRFAVEHDARIEQACDLIMERERLDEVAAVELLRFQAQIEDQPIRAVAERLLARPRR
ncbi:MAG: putative sensor protein [Actinomycetia bacterium]|nr:putative sensor protein [Actinomycetes bacterium]